MPKRTAQLSKIRQSAFAKRVAEAFDAARKWGVQQKDVAEALGWDETTLSRYKDPEYEKGPPKAQRRRLLERAIGIPEGYLDRTTGDISVLRKGGGGHSAVGESAVTYLPENVRGQTPPAEVGVWKTVADSVARRWHQIIVHRRIPWWDLIDLLIAEEEFLRERGKARNQPALIDAADDTRKLITELTALKEPR